MLNIDEGYFFGIGAFETVAVEQGKAVFLDAHYERLRRAIAFLEMNTSLTGIKEQVEEVLKAPGMREGRKVLKITVSDKNLLVTSRENTYTQEDYEKGFRAIYSQVRRNETSHFTYHKTLNYGDCLMEKRHAKTLGMDEPIFLNTRGEIAEGTTTNVFFVKKGEIFTPPVSSGLLPGILRNYICTQYPVTERVLHPQEVADFDEMFLTNSLLGVMPVSCLASHTFASRETGERLMEEYFRCVNEAQGI